MEGNGGYAKFDYIGSGFALKEHSGIKATDLKRITAVVEENADIIVNYGNNYFNK